MEQVLPTAVLGRTGLEITKLGYGSGGRKQYPSDEHWGTLLNGVLDAGITFIDTANAYGRAATSGRKRTSSGDFTRACSA